MTQATIYNPQLQVLLYKNVDRTTAGDGVPLSERFKAADRVIDLAPWLDDQTGVRTSKSVRDPAGGWSVTLSDRMHSKDLDTLYGLIEPMDCIEIRMARTRTKPGNLPIIMRGFVSNISRSESISGSGKPQRTVTITGQDYGKLWQIFQIFYPTNFPESATLLTNWKLFQKFGMAFNNQSCRDFVREAIDRILNPFITNMLGKNESGQPAPDSPLQIIQVKDEDITAEPGTVAPTGANQFQGGTLYSMLQQFGDVGPWNELFLEDREEGVFLVYRPNPFYAVNGDYLPTKRFNIEEAKEPAVAVVRAEDIQSINVSRSDSNVANYYWVEARRSQMTNGSTAKMIAATSARETFYTTHRNSSEEIYGLRKMMEETNQGDPQAKHHGNGVDKDTHKRLYTLTSGWIDQRRYELVEQNKDNVVFELGSLRVKGNEAIKAGMYVEIVRGTMKHKVYAYQVDHEFVPFQGFFTTITFDRGTGFIERAKDSGRKSPYLEELASV